MNTSWKMSWLFNSLSKFGKSGIYWQVSLTSTNRRFTPVFWYLNDGPSSQANGSYT